MLKSKLEQEMKVAMKEKDVLRLSTIRMVRSSIKYKEIEIGRSLDDIEVVGIISTAIKQRNDSFEQFSKAGREDLATKEKKEIDILLNYMPAQASSEELRNRIKEVIEETGTTSIKDIGKIMKIVLAEFKGQADGAKINLIAKDLLS